MDDDDGGVVGVDDGEMKTDLREQSPTTERRAL